MMTQLMGEEVDDEGEATGARVRKCGVCHHFHWGRNVSHEIVQKITYYQSWAK